MVSKWALHRRFDDASPTGRFLMGVVGGGLCTVLWFALIVIGIIQVAGGDNTYVILLVVGAACLLVCGLDPIWLWWQRRNGETGQGRAKFVNEYGQVLNGKNQWVTPTSYFYNNPTTAAAAAGATTVAVTAAVMPRPPPQYFPRSQYAYPQQPQAFAQPAHYV